jgi:hypothetical protein
MHMRGPIQQNPLTLDQLLPFPTRSLCQQVFYIVISHPTSLKYSVRRTRKGDEHAWKKNWGLESNL